MQEKTAKYDLSKWDRDLVSSTVENGNLLKALIGRGVDIEEIRKYLTGPLRTPMDTLNEGPSQKLKEFKYADSYSRRHLKSLLNIKPSLIKADERAVFESTLRRLEDMASLTKECKKTQYERLLKAMRINPRLKTKNQREGMIIYNLHAILNPIALRMSYTQQDTFSLIAELLNITNPEIEPTNIYDTNQVKDLYFSILKFT